MIVQGFHVSELVRGLLSLGRAIRFGEFRGGFRVVGTMRETLSRANKRQFRDGDSHASLWRLVLQNRVPFWDPFSKGAAL